MELFKVTVMREFESRLVDECVYFVVAEDVISSIKKTETNKNTVLKFELVAAEKSAGTTLGKLIL